MRHSWKQKAKQNKHRQMNKQHKKQTAQTPTNNNKHIHVCLFRVLLWLLCSLLTYKGTCGIVGAKKSKTTQTQTNEQTTQKQTAQPTTNNNKYKHVFVCFVFCYGCYVRY